jgi:hypothetical protein
MNFQKVRQISDRVSKNRHKLMNEKEPKKKEVLRLKIQIDELKEKLERLKD